MKNATKQNTGRARIEAIRQNQLDNPTVNPYTAPAKQARIDRAKRNGWILAEAWDETLAAAQERNPQDAEDAEYIRLWDKIVGGTVATPAPQKPVVAPAPVEPAPKPVVRPAARSNNHNGPKEATHNGTFTVVSQKGGHRTFRIRTEDDFRNRDKKTRFIGLLVGSNNETDYLTIGEVAENGTLRVWNKQEKAHGETARLFWALLTEGEHRWAAGCKLEAATTCRRCNRKLTDPVSLNLGIGPICREKGI